MKKKFKSRRAGFVHGYDTSNGFCRELYLDWGGSFTDGELQEMIGKSVIVTIAVTE